jgi:hypothetical protein
MLMQSHYKPLSRCLWIGLLLYLVGCARSTPVPITTWIEVPQYPNIGQVVEHQRDEAEEMLVFTTTYPITDVLGWYETTYTSPGWYPVHGGSLDLYPELRSFIKDSRTCYHFILTIEFDAILQVYRQTLSRNEGHSCSGP